jgi:four helix bundle protein
MNENTQINTYKDLIVWQKSMQLVFEIYKVTEGFPKEEMYGLTSQIRRAAVSIPTNIAEGRFRGTKKDYTQFLRISYSSGAELETEIEIARNLFKTKHLDYKKVDDLLLEVMKILNVMIRKLNTNEAKS